MADRSLSASGLGGRLTPRPRPRRMIALTPLVDVVFLLLTFFMLSTQLSHFALLPLDGRQAAPATSADRGGAEAAALPQTSDLLLSVGRANFRLNGTPVAAPDLGSALADARQRGIRGVTILAARDATMQDLAAALEAATLARIRAVAIANGQ